MSADFGVLLKDMNLAKRVIFDQWLKLHIGLDLEPEISILKGLYYISIGSICIAPTDIRGFQIENLVFQIKLNLAKLKGLFLLTTGSERLIY